MIIANIFAVIMCIGGLFSLLIVVPSSIQGWRAAPLYYHLSRLGFPILVLLFFGPRALGIDLTGNNLGFTFLYLAALGFVVGCYAVYLYREPGATYRKMPLPTNKPNKPNLIVRKAQGQDMAGVGRIFAHAFGRNFDLDFGIDRKRNGHLLGELLTVKQAEITVAIIEETGEVVGAIWLDLGDQAVVSMSPRRSWPILKRYLTWLQALYFAYYALPAIMAKRGTSQEGYVQWLGVDPATQGVGVGQLLIEDAISVCQVAGKRQIALHTERSNYPACKLYSRNGFQEVGWFRLSPRIHYVKTL